MISKCARIFVLAQCNLHHYMNMLVIRPSIHLFIRYGRSAEAIRPELKTSLYLKSCSSYLPERGVPWNPRNPSKSATAYDLEMRSGASKVSLTPCNITFPESCALRRRNSIQTPLNCVYYYVVRRQRDFALCTCDYAKA